MDSLLCVMPSGIHVLLCVNMDANFTDQTNERSFHRSIIPTETFPYETVVVQITSIYEQFRNLCNIDHFFFGMENTFSLQWQVSETNFTKDAQNWIAHILHFSSANKLPSKLTIQTGGQLQTRWNINSGTSIHPGGRLQTQEATKLSLPTFEPTVPTFRLKF